MKHSIPKEPQEQLAQFASAIWQPGDMVEVRCIHPHRKGAKQNWHRAADLPAQFDKLLKLNQTGYGVYAGVNPRRREGGCKAADVKLARAHFVDLDGGIGVADALKRVTAANLSDPSIIVASGHGIHFYWLSPEPITDLASWKQIQKRLIELLEADRQCSDASRVFRLPGFINTKDKPIPCELVKCLADHRPTLQRPTESTEITETTEITEKMSSVVSVVSVSRLIQQTQPLKAGQRTRCIFKLARALKFMPGAAADPAVFRNDIRQWHRLALPIIGTKDFDTSWSDFLRAWERARTPPGAVVIQAMKHADLADDPPCAQNYDHPQTIRLIKLCRELQRIAGDDPFFLSCRDAGRMIGMDHATAADRLNMLIADKVLLLVQRQTERRARRYHFIGE